MISWLDAFLVLMLLVSIAIGFHEGLIRQALLLLAIYIGTVMSAQYYSNLASLLLRVAPSSETEMAHVVAFLALVAFFSLAVTVLIRLGYRETKLPALAALDTYGGSLLGAVSGLFAISLTVMMAKYALQIPWPEGSLVKHVLRVGVSDSIFQNVLSVPLPIFLSALEPFLPPNIPFLTK